MKTDKADAIPAQSSLDLPIHWVSVDTMSRKRSNTDGSLPTPAPENIATREYYHASEAINAHDGDMEYPESRTPAPEKQQGSTGEGRGAPRSRELDGFVEVRTDAPDSPSPSDVVLAGDLADMPALSDLEQATRDMPGAQRKTLLLKLQEDLRVERAKKAEEDEKERRELVDQEYKEAQMKGRDDV